MESAKLVDTRLCCLTNGRLSTAENHAVLDWVEGLAVLEGIAREATHEGQAEKANRPKLIPVATAESASGLSSCASTWKTITMVHIPAPKTSMPTPANRSR